MNSRLTSTSSLMSFPTFTCKTALHISLMQLTRPLRKPHRKPKTVTTETFIEIQGDKQLLHPSHGALYAHATIKSNVKLIIHHAKPLFAYRFSEFFLRFLLHHPQIRKVHRFHPILYIFQKGSKERYANTSSLEPPM